MEEYELVILNKDFEDLKKGTKGTIVLKYNEDDYEVEFFDDQKNTIGVYTINISYLDKRYKNKWVDCLLYINTQDILKIVNNYENMQSITTTHNITLMNKQITRSDCCYLISDNKVLPLYKLNKKEIREKNNLQNMSVNGEFSNILEKNEKEN